MKELARYSKVVLWGGKGNLDSIRWIYAGFDKTLRKLGVPVEWVPDVAENRHVIDSRSLVWAVNVAAANIGPWVEGSDVVTHNFDADTELAQTVPDSHHLRFQVYTSDAEQYAHERWDECRLYHAPNTLFAPWGTDILSEEFFEPVFNGGSDLAAFVGAKWDDGGLGNASLFPRLEAALSRRRIRLEHHTQISDNAMRELVRSSRIAPAFAGDWQVGKNYVPCRTLKHPSYGVLSVTNVPKVRELFAGCHVEGETVEEIIDSVLKLTQKDYLAMTKAQAAVVSRYTFRETLVSFARALEAGR